MTEQRRWSALAANGADRMSAPTPGPVVAGAPTAEDLYLVQAHDKGGRLLYHPDGSLVLIDRRLQAPHGDAAASAIWWVFGLQVFLAVLLVVVAARAGR